MEVRYNLVSTIIPVFNRGALAVEATSSVLKQTHDPVEVILVDDGSTDDTPDILDAIARRHSSRVRVIHKTNSGPGPSREAGRQLVRGEFIQYLDSDDLLLPRKFERQVALLRANPTCGVAYGKTRYYRLGQEHNARVFKDTDKHYQDVFPGFLNNRRWGTSTPLYRREVTDRIGSWLNLWAEEDWEYDCRLGAQRVRLCYCDEFVSEQRGLPGARLSQAGRDDPRTLASQAGARDRILAHALTAGLRPGSLEMRLFARQLFMLARDCGAAGLVAEARKLLRLSRRAAGSDYLGRIECWAYQFGSTLLGWGLTGRLAKGYERRLRGLRLSR
jgi:glycosyltransferase involved in cell wall biosynthesis